jgi:hypothetical protein
LDIQKKVYSKAVSEYVLPASSLADKSRTVSARIRKPEVRSNYIVPVLAKAIKIIRLLETADRPLNINEISQYTGTPKSTVYRVLRTLSAYGYLPHGAIGIYSFKFIAELQPPSPTPATAKEHETVGASLRAIKFPSSICP